jgi:hypothetical protein
MRLFENGKSEFLMYRERFVQILYAEAGPFVRHGGRR